jgi:hypothetical protein
MSSATRNARLTGAVTSLRTLGESVAVPSGTVLAVVEVPGHEGELRAQATTTSGRLALPHQALPQMWLAEADAAALREQDAVTVRGVGYLVARLTPDGAGMVRVQLALLGTEPLPRPEWRQWR